MIKIRNPKLILYVGFILVAIVAVVAVKWHGPRSGVQANTSASGQNQPERPAPDEQVNVSVNAVSDDGDVANPSETPPTDSGPENGREHVDTREAWLAIRKIIAEHKTVDAVEAVKPAFAVVGQPDAASTTAVPLAHRRRSERAPWRGGTPDLPTTSVVGTVYVVTDSGLAPLAGALVVDSEGRRAFTGDDGTFRIEAGVSDADSNASRSHDDDAANDIVYLNALCPGYELTHVNHGFVIPYVGGANFPVNACRSLPGAEFYLVPVETEQVTVRITEPSPPPAEITIWAGWLGVGGESDHYDLDFFVQGIADENGEVSFTAPKGLLGSHFGAYGPGYAGGLGDFREIERAENGRIVELSLRQVANHRISGTVADMRTGVPLAGCRVQTRQPGEVAFTDDGGYFQMYVSGRWGIKSPEEYPNYLQARAWGYLGVACRLDVDESRHFEAGTLSRPPSLADGGDWIIQLRPYVQANGHVLRADGSPLSDGRLEYSPSGLLLDDRVLQAVTLGSDGSFTWDFLPWGISTVRFSGFIGTRFGESTLTIEPGAWSLPEPLTLELRLNE